MLERRVSYLRAEFGHLGAFSRASHAENRSQAKRGSRVTAFPKITKITLSVPNPVSQRCRALLTGPQGISRGPEFSKAIACFTTATQAPSCGLPLRRTSISADGWTAPYAIIGATGRNSVRSLTAAWQKLLALQPPQARVNALCREQTGRSKNKSKNNERGDDTEEIT
jgi:hypothetical protein